MKYFCIEDSASLRVTGPDAESYLQGQCSQDLASLSKGDSCYVLWLSPKGRLIADSLVYKNDDDNFILWNRGHSADAFISLVQKNLIMDDAQIEELHFAKATAVFEEYEVRADEILLRHPLGMTVILGEVDSAQLTNTYTKKEFDFERISRGIVLVPDEFGEKDLPVEAGLDHCAVSYEKGCFLGQDMLARLRLQGDSRKVAIKVRLDQKLKNEGVLELFASENKVGEIRAAASGDHCFVGVAKVTRKSLTEPIYLLENDQRIDLAYEIVS